MAYECTGPAGFANQTSGNARQAQTFVAGLSGTLRQITVAIFKGSAAGDYIVQIVTVSGDVPSNSPADVLAAVTIAAATVPPLESTLVANFSGTPVVQNTEYAVVVTRPGASSLHVVLRDGDGSACPGVFSSSNGGGAFTNIEEFDLLVSVLIE